MWSFYRCPKCGGEIKSIGAAGQSVCPKCGILELPSSSIQSKPSQAKYCQHCGKEFPTVVSFCPSCGRPLKLETAQCSNCGFEMKEGDQFCERCGAKRVPDALKIASPSIVDAVQLPDNTSLRPELDSEVLSVKEVLNILKPVLDEYMTEKKSIEDEIKLRGTIPKSVCDQCPLVKKGWRRMGEKVAKLDDHYRPMATSLLKWMRKSWPYKNVHKPFIDAQTASRHGFSELLGLDFGGRISSCTHLEREPRSDESVIPVLVTYPQMPPDLATELELLCDDCYARIDSIGCEGSIIKTRFTYIHHCPLRYILLRKLLEKYKMNFETLEDIRYPSELFVFSGLLPKLNILMTTRIGWCAGKEFENIVKVVKPGCLLVFGETVREMRETIPNLLSWGTSIIVFNDESGQITSFDKEQEVEESTDKIIQAIIDKLDKYSTQVHGKAHNRLIGAFQRIGRDLGFAPESELSDKAARIDVVWLNRSSGKVEVAIEVETSQNWKKDIITTWELGPRLAVILIHQKREKGISDMLQYRPVKSMPHDLLIINYLLKKAYLIKQGQIIKYYEMAKSEEQEKKNTGPLS